MERRYSSITTFDGPVNNSKDAKKKTQPNAYADTLGNMRTLDPNMKGFILPALRSLQPLTMAAMGAYYTTLGVVDPVSFGGGEGYPIFSNDQTTVIGRTGQGAVSIPYVKPGSNPIGWRNPGMKKVQKREKVIYNNSNPDVYFSWRNKARWVPLDYVLQPDERLDGGLSIGHDRAHALYDKATSTSGNTTDIDLGSDSNKYSDFTVYSPQLYGNSFPTGEKGMLQYSPKVYDDDAWSGEVKSADDDSKYTVDVVSIDPTEGKIGDVVFVVASITYTTGDEQYIQDIITGGFTEVRPLVHMYVGPFLVDFYVDGQYGWYSASPGTGFVTGQVTFPDDADPGSYDFTLIGPSGQVSVLKDAFTLKKAEKDWNAIVEGSGGA